VKLKIGRYKLHAIYDTEHEVTPSLSDSDAHRAAAWASRH